MALTQPGTIPQPWGSDGQGGTIPQDTTVSGKASWAIGFPPETALPLSEGGVPPSYLDFQGVLNVLSAHNFFQQSGAHYTWANSLDYPVGAFVMGSDNKLYQALQASGPGYSAGAKNPTTSAAYWSVVPLASDIQALQLENTAAAHNGVYRGKNLTGIYTLDQLSAKVQANDWSDLYIGDSIEVPMTSTRGGAETVRWLFAGFDWYINTGDTKLTQHHIVMVPENCFKDNAQMNATNTTEGADKGSEMYKTVLTDYAAAIKASGSFGSHVAKYRATLSNTMTSTVASGAGADWKGASTNWEWYDTELRLMTEVEVYGSRVFSSSLYDVGIGNRQLPLFQLAPQHFVCGHGLNPAETDRWAWWLSAVAAAARFAIVSGLGDAGSYLASGASGVRPLFLFI